MSVRVWQVAAFAYVLVLMLVALEVPLGLNLPKRVEAEVRAIGSCDEKARTCDFVFSWDYDMFADGSKARRFGSPATYAGSAVKSTTWTMCSPARSRACIVPGP